MDKQTQKRLQWSVNTRSITPSTLKAKADNANKYCCIISINFGNNKGTPGSPEHKYVFRTCNVLPLSCFHLAQSIGVPLFPSVLFSFCFDFFQNKTEGFPGITFSFAVKGKSLFPSVFSKTEAFQNIQLPSKLKVKKNPQKLKVKKHTIEGKSSLVYILNFGLY